MNVCWITSKVNNMDETLKFYESILELECTRRFFLEKGKEIAFVDGKSIQLEFVYNEKKSGFNHNKDISVGFLVDDLDEWIQKVNNNKIEIFRGPIEANDGVRFFFIQDPNGMVIQFFENSK